MTAPFAPLADVSTHVPFLLAQQGGNGPNYSISWAIILLSVILGLLVTLRLDKRESEVKERRS